MPTDSSPHGVEVGLGGPPDPESLLDKIDDVTPLRADGLAMLVGHTLCAVVYDNDISINYLASPTNGNLMGAKSRDGGFPGPDSNPDGPECRR